MAKKAVTAKESLRLNKHDSALIIKKDGRVEISLPDVEGNVTTVNVNALLVTAIAMLLQSGNDEFDQLIRKQFTEMSKMAEEMIEAETPNVTVN